MNTYIVTVHVGTSVQVIVSAENEDEAETIASNQVTKELQNKNSKIHKEIEAIEAEVNQKISNTPLFDIP